MVFFPMAGIARRPEPQLAANAAWLARQFFAVIRVRQRMRRHLKRLSDRELKDIGLTRSDVSGYTQFLNFRDHSEFMSRSLPSSFGTR